MSARLVANLGLGHIRLVKETPQSVPGPECEYGDAKGSPALRETLASWENVPFDEVAITTGASLGLVATFASVGRGASILCSRPHYPLYPKMARILGLDIIYYDLQRDLGWQPDPRQIEQLVRPDTRALLLNFPGNPTGTLPSGNLLEKLARIVDKFHLLVISDEVYADLIYTSDSFPDMQTVFGRRSVVRLKSFSKLFCMAGERVGYVIADHQRLEAISDAHWALAMSPPAAAQALALTALRNNPERKIGRLHKSLLNNRDQAAEILANCDRLKFAVPRAGIFKWIEILNCPLDSLSFVRACAEETGVVVVPGSAFGIASPVFLRASFAVPAHELMIGFQELVSFIAHLPVHEP